MGSTRSKDVHDLPEDEEWRAEMLKHLLEERDQGPLDKEDLEWLNYLFCDYFLSSDQTFLSICIMYLSIAYKHG